MKIIVGNDILNITYLLWAAQKADAKELKEFSLHNRGVTGWDASEESRPFPCTVTEADWV